MFIVRVARRAKEAGRGSKCFAGEAPKRDTSIRLETDDVGLPIFMVMGTTVLNDE
jgi:hypothetical protein